MDLKINNIIIEIFVSVISVCAAIIIFISQRGYDYSDYLPFETVLITLNIIYTPEIICRYLHKKNINSWYTNKGFILFISLIILVLLGNITKWSNIDLSILVALIGICQLLYFINTNLSSIKLIPIVIIIIFILFGIFITTAYYLSYNYHPLIYQKIITGGWAHRDPVWFSTIAGMFKTYGVSTNGLDGLVPLYYHIMSYYVAGALSNILNINTLTFYNTVYPIMIVPISIMSLLICVMEIGKYYSELLNYKYSGMIEYKFWILLLIIISLPLPYQLLGILDGERYQYFTSHSYSYALFTSFTILVVVLGFNKINYFINNNNIIYSKYFFSTTIVILYLIASLSKVSFLYVIGSVYGYIFVRNKLYKYNLHRITMCGFIIVVMVVYYYILNTEEFLKNPFQIKSYNISILSYITYIYPTITFIVLKLYACSSYLNYDILKLFRNKKLMDIEILIFLMIILFPITYQYFKGIQTQLAMVLILAHYNLFYNAIIYNNNR